MVSCLEIIQLLLQHVPVLGLPRVSGMMYLQTSDVALRNWPRLAVVMSAAAELLELAQLHYSTMVPFTFD